ncbi:MAG: T9SS type A sorting domain-containing protein [Candidatus Pedobacter colombiensis]|uniref:T9SS type A sorting domain-containing protein n=1 Tax=Candidatus Pedobacter colombiensis TaxID=3121371 RepID=A0AAJ6B599_9SPHI|nr:T9SS type A sorting domain-containing protein [Pedobacter sp.]WEK17955.1 MAG: T9SS type A sorting domain-containing protein [Pedobacter sp.]
MNHKLFGLLLLSSISLTVNAQISINATDYPVGGGVVYTYKSDTTALSQGESGENKTWNFSQLNTITTSDYITHDCGDTTLCDTFPGSNFYNINVGANSSSFYIKDASGIYLNGYYKPGVKNTFNDPRQILKFPIQYNTSFTDTFASDVNFGNVLFYVESGIISVSVDGYGTVKTPIGTYVNTLRIKTILTIHAIDGTISQTEIYGWYQSGIGSPVMEISNTHSIPEGQPPAFRNYRYITTAPVQQLGIEETQNKTNNIFIYPNPARNQFRVNVGNLKNYAINVRNVLGSTVFKSSPTLNQTETTITTSGWAKGIYIVEVTGIDGSSVPQKIILE